MDDMENRPSAGSRTQAKNLTPNGRKTPQWNVENNPEAEALRIFETLYPAMKPTTAPAHANDPVIPKNGKFPQRRENATTKAEAAREQDPKGSGTLLPSNVDNVDKRGALRQAIGEWAAFHPIRANARTKARYRRLAEMMERTGESPETSTNANTFQGRKAATFLWIAEELQRWLDEGGDPDHAESLLERAAGLAALTWSAIKPAKPTARRSKANLSDLPPDWKEKMFERATERLRLPLVLLEIGGMRPEEIGRPAGVQVSLVAHDGDGVRFRLLFEGAKVGEGHGVAAGNLTGWQRRELLVDVVGDRADWLAEVVTAAGGTLSYRADASHLKDNVRSLAKRIWPRRKAENRPSTYSYRHAFSSTQKAAGTDPAMLAIAMGHRAERTQGRYGRPSRTTNPDVRLISARATDNRPGDTPRKDLRSRLHPKP